MASKNWRQTAWVMDTSGMDELFTKLEQIPNRSEAIINSRLRAFGGPLAAKTIVPLIPISERKKIHARFSNPLTVKYDNLQFMVRPRPKFNYIKYPDLAIGTSAGKDPVNFMRRGLLSAKSRIVADLTDAIDQEINKTLGG